MKALAINGMMNTPKTGAFTSKCNTRILLYCLLAASSNSEVEVNFSPLMTWYDKHDIVCSKLAVRTPEGGVRGLFAEKDISPYEGIAVIPPHMIIKSPFKDSEEIVQVNLQNFIVL